MAPQFWFKINFNRPEKGVGFFSPPNIWSRKDLSPYCNICGILRHFPAFSRVFRRFPVYFLRCSDLAIICSVLQCFPVCGAFQCVAAFCGVLQRFAVFCGVCGVCGVLQLFAAFWGVLQRLGDKFPLQDQIFGGGSNPPPSFLVG